MALWVKLYAAHSRLHTIRPHPYVELVAAEKSCVLLSTCMHLIHTTNGGAAKPDRGNAATAKKTASPSPSLHLFLAVWMQLTRISMPLFVGKIWNMPAAPAAARVTKQEDSWHESPYWIVPSIQEKKWARNKPLVVPGYKKKLLAWPCF